MSAWITNATFPECSPSRLSECLPWDNFGTLGNSIHVADSGDAEQIAEHSTSRAGLELDLRTGGLVLRAHRIWFICAAIRCIRTVAGPLCIEQYWNSPEHKYLLYYARLTLMNKTLDRHGDHIDRAARTREFTDRALRLPQSVR